MIGNATGAELFKIQQKEPYSPNYKRCIDQAMADKRADARPELVKMPENLDGYDEIYLGYPTERDGILLSRHSPSVHIFQFS